MIRITKTDSNNHDFIVLVRSLDVMLGGRDGADHAFYAQFNTIDKIKHVVLAHGNENR